MLLIYHVQSLFLVTDRACWWCWCWDGSSCPFTSLLGWGIQTNTLKYDLVLSSLIVVLFFLIITLPSPGDDHARIPAEAVWWPKNTVIYSYPVLIHLHLHKNIGMTHTSFCNIFIRWFCRLFLKNVYISDHLYTICIY